MTEGLVNLSYLAAAVLFIAGLKRLRSPATARRGNFAAAGGMLLAVVVTLIDPLVNREDLPLIFGGIVLGSVIGIYLARTTKMTSMPQMVALLNGFGGGASALVAAGELTRLLAQESTPGSEALVSTEVGIAIQLSTLIGGITFAGSAIAFARLQELMSGRPLTYAMQKPGNLLLLLVVIALATYLIVAPDNPGLFLLLVLASLAVGALFVLPIGGADMPVVISLLNSFSGVAAAFTGFVISNYCLIISGALVGAAGLILTQIMCKAMNRSLANVLFGAFGAVHKTGGKDGAQEERSVREISAEDSALILGYARLVIVAPGYGLAVAQAQHQVREFADLLEERGVEVKYAIHPVAGRMPGHMNVLLAEANVPYPQLYDMDSINPEFQRADAVMVIGANDVVNPAAHSDPSSPIYGMPILDVDKAATVIVLKRSMNPGFAGIENELFYNSKTQMLFGDAKASLSKLIEQVKAL
jgi:NAD(P) transhydrogenase subunit beta